MNRTGDLWRAAVRFKKTDFPPQPGLGFFFFSPAVGAALPGVGKGTRLQRLPVSGKQTAPEISSCIWEARNYKIARCPAILLNEFQQVLHFQILRHLRIPGSVFLNWWRMPISWQWLIRKI